MKTSHKNQNRSQNHADKRDQRSDRRNRNNPEVVREQPKKDSSVPRVNLDNARESRAWHDLQVMRKERNTSNAYAWYAKNPELAKIAGQLGFSHSTGIPVYINSYSYKAPSVCAYYFCNVLGNEVAINQAKDSIYSFTVHANSRNTSYEAADEMMLILAGKEVFMAIANLIRIYGCMTMYTQENANLPSLLVEASGVSFASARDNYYKMLFDINQLIAQTKQIWIPNTMPVIEREFWMASHVYMDSSTDKGQFFMYVPATYYQYNETLTTTGGGLEAVSRSNWAPDSKTVSWATAVSVVQQMINTLIASEDRGLIFGDILKAYGPERIYRLNEIDASYKVVPTYDAEVLTQLSNITIMRLGDTFPKIQQDPLKGITSPTETWCEVTSNDSSYYLPKQHLLNWHGGQPTSEQVMIMTRMTAVSNDVSAVSGKYYIQPIATGTELCVAAVLWSKGTNGSREGVTFYSHNKFASTAESTASLSAWSVFDWMPIVYVSAGATYPITQWLYNYGPSVQNVIGDVENILIVGLEEMKRLHLAAIFSEYGVPVSI